MHESDHQSKQTLPLVDGPITFAGAVSLRVSDQGVQPWRLPHDQLDLFEPALHCRAGRPAGVRLTMISDTPTLEIDAHFMPQDDPPNEPHFPQWTLDLLVDGILHQRVTQPIECETFIFNDIQLGQHLLEVYLSQHSGMRIDAVRIDKGATAQRYDDPRPRWLAYGSSITQCCGAAGPSDTWPAIVARRYNLNLTCLGFDGQCHFDTMVARVIRELNLDYISLCFDINVYGDDSMTDRIFRGAVIGLIKTIRDQCPATPIVIVSPLYTGPRENTPNNSGMSLVCMRVLISNAAQTLQHHGDNHLIYQSGVEVFGPEHQHNMPEGDVHPTAAGYLALAQRYGDIVMPKLGLKEK